MTFKLLTTASGIKMGKTEKGAIWLDKEKTTPYEMYQYLRNTDDRDVINFLKLLTMLPLDEIKKYENLEGAELNIAKDVLAYEIVKDVHGEEEAKKAKDASKALFSGNGSLENIPSTDFSSDDFKDGKGLLDLLTLLGLTKTNSEARRLISQGGIKIDDNKIDDPNLKITLDMFNDNKLLIKKGKKIYHQVHIK